MAMYSSGNVKTDYIDPHVNIQGKRTEFHLNPESGYYSNLRIVNLGANIAAKSFNKIAGVYSLVKHCYLYDYFLRFYYDIVDKLVLSPVSNIHMVYRHVIQVPWFLLSSV